MTLNLWYNLLIIKEFWSKYKRIILIAFAVVFLVLLFFIKNTSVFKNDGGTSDGLAYSNALVEDLVNKDSDQDGIEDWEEGLWGLDPAKKETTPGIPDSTAVAKLKISQEWGDDEFSGGQGGASEENLTETDKFSRELFATVAALNENGSMDANTAEQISASLYEHLRNPAPAKTYVMAELNIAKDDSQVAVKSYASALNNLFGNYKFDKSVVDVMDKFIVDENNVDSSVLVELDPIINQTQKIIGSIVGLSVPPSLSPLHLDLLNALEKIAENLNNMKLYDTDTILALSSISQYEDNVALAQTAVQSLASGISRKLNF